MGKSTINYQRVSLPDSLPAIFKVWPLFENGPQDPQVWKHLCRLDHRGHSLSLFHHHLVALRLVASRHLSAVDSQHPNLLPSLLATQPCSLVRFPSFAATEQRIRVVLCMIMFSRCVATCTMQECSSPVDHTSVSTNHAITDTNQPPKNSVGFRVPQWLDDPSHPNLQRASTQIHNRRPISQCLGETTRLCQPMDSREIPGLVMSKKRLKMNGHF